MSAMEDKSPQAFTSAPTIAPADRIAELNEIDKVPVAMFQLQPFFLTQL